MPFDGVTLNEEGPVLRILRGARELLRDETAWCRRALMVDANGNEPGYERGAYTRVPVSFCALGAIEYAGWQLNATIHEQIDAQKKLGQALWVVIGNSNVAPWNDGVAQHHEVLELYDRAIETEARGCLTLTSSRS